MRAALAVARRHGADLIILSDANAFFIHTVLRVRSTAADRLCGHDRLTMSAPPPETSACGLPGVRCGPSL
jgi:hypothetical protein